MPFQQPITIAKALDRIHKHEYVLPAIQREFVWSTDQICMLFDSLMRGYPFGSFLFWKMDKDTCRKYVFYDFMREYHERDARHCCKLTLDGGETVTAVLDGQQRFTALNIGLRGSHAEKLPYKRWSSDYAYPRKQLYLNLRGSSGDDELRLQYQFKFIEEARTKAENSETCHWFRVGRILTMESGPEMFDYIQENGLANDKAPFRMLDRLHTVIHKDSLVTYYEEEDQHLDKVLNIFIRVNSGGTVLSYADLLLSIATAQWKDRDARDAVYRLVDELNKKRFGFSFPKDMVLKACLVLADIPDVGFKVKNFDAANMHAIEIKWDEIARALDLAARLLADFGFSEKTLTANNVLIPVAYYLMKRGAPSSYLTASGEAEDRERVWSWVVRSLVKAGIWGSGLDSLLRTLREVLKDAPLKKAFPLEDIESAMVPLGKSLRFDEEEIDSILESQYGRQGTFAILSLLYPGLDLRNEFHQDHVFPRSMFTRKKLRDAGVPDEKVEKYLGMVDQLPNLQLLLGPLNQEKLDKLPHAWLAMAMPDPTQRASYLTRHDLVELPESVVDFDKFFEARKARMKSRLVALLRGAEKTDAEL